MNFVKVKDIINVCNATLLCGDENITVKTFSKDTRTITTNDFYVGIKGENFDGNKFFETALDKGAIGCMIENDVTNDILKKYSDKVIIRVNNSIEAIQKLASFKRSLYDIPVVAVTGSVGKTSTKDIISSVLGENYKVLKTEGNLNNHIGLPFTLLKLEDHTAAVIEMGMSNFGEISLLTRIAKPTIAVITNIGTSHIGILGSRENILKAKLEILEGLQPGGKLIINNDNDLLHEYSKNHDNQNIITYGIENSSEFMASRITLHENSSNFILSKSSSKFNISVPVGGKHFIYNALCAFSIGNTLKIDSSKIINGINNFELTKSRMDIQKSKNEVTIINDSYNASYDSMKASLEYLKNLSAKRKIAVLGDMLELGDYSKELHEKVGIEVHKNNINVLITVGNYSKYIFDMANSLGIENSYHFINNSEAIIFLKQFLKPKDVVLLKASHSMKFNEILKEII